MEELPEKEIQQAESVPSEHSHEGVFPEDSSLADHLRRAHQLDEPGSLSSTTEQGLHDRLHHQSGALDR